MTTTVKVEAHVSSDKEVLMQLTENGKVIEEFILQDGEKLEGYVHGDQIVTVQEVVKKSV